MTTDRLEITAVDVRKFKRIDHVHIETEDHRNILLIAGKNRAGKSSLMDALDAAFSGGEALPTEPIKEGEDASVINVELNDGMYKIKRGFSVGKAGSKSEGKLLTQLTVTGPDGKLSSPQTWLDNLVAQRFLDPLAFLAKKPDEQRKILLEIIGVDVDALQSEHKQAYEARTEVNRQLKAATVQLETLVDPGPAPAGSRSAAEIQDELDVVEEDARAGELAHTKYASCKEMLGRLEEEAAAKRKAIEQLERQLAATKAELGVIEERVKKGGVVTEEAKAAAPALEATNALATRRVALKAEMREVEAYIRWESQALAHRKRFEQLTDAVKAHEVEAGRLTAVIEGVAQRRVEMLAKAKMPVEELSVSDTGLRLDSVPLDQASQSEQLRCALAISIARSPRLRDVWAKSGSLLDEEGIEELRRVAQDLDCRVWLEMVNERPGDTRAVIIRDGKALGQAEVTES